MFNPTERMRVAPWVRHPLAVLTAWFSHPDPAGDRELRWYPSPTGRADAVRMLAASQKFINHKAAHQPPIALMVKRFAVAVLSVDYGLGSGRPIERIYIAPHSRLLVGSHPGCDVVISGSPKHLEFISDDDTVRVMDLGSGADTFIESEQLLPDKTRTLMPGDVVHLRPSTTITCLRLPGC